MPRIAATSGEEVHLVPVAYPLDYRPRQLDRDVVHEDERIAGDLMHGKHPLSISPLQVLGQKLEGTVPGIPRVVRSIGLGARVVEKGLYPLYTHLLPILILLDR